MKPRETDEMKGTSIVYLRVLLAVGGTSAALLAHDLPHMVRPQHFDGTNSLHRHFIAQKIPVQIREQKAADGGKWVICTANPYSGALATDCYLYRAKPGKESLGFVSLYMAKNAGMSECEIEVVEDGIWLRILGERFAYYRQ
jgi:hypothetical protein